MKKAVLAILCIFALSACKKEDKQVEPAIPQTPVIATGNLKGKVYHYDQFGTAYTNGLNTTTVSIEGKNYATITDTAGRFTISGVSSNTYTLIFKKPGCGMIKLEDIEYKVEDTLTYTAGVADIPVFTISSAYAKDTSWFSNTLDGIYYNASTNPVNKNASVVAIIGKSPKIDIANPSSYLNYATVSLVDTTEFNRFFSYSLLKFTYTFKKDSMLYMKIYPVATKAASYLNNKSNTLIYTAYGTPYPTVFTFNVQ